MDILQTWLEGSDVPVLTAFILGLLTAASPCPLATNITAVGFIGKGIESKNRTFLYGLLYTLGRIIAYTLLGTLLIWMLQRGIDTFDLQSEVSRWGELMLSPILIIVGLLMLFGDRLPLVRFGFGDSQRSERLRGGMGQCVARHAVCHGVLPHKRLFLFRHPHSHVGIIRRRLCLACHICHCDGIARGGGSLDNRL